MEPQHRSREEGRKSYPPKALTCVNRPDIRSHKGYSIDSLNDSTRAITLGLLVFLGNFILGSLYLPTEFYFWALGVSRVVLAVGLAFLPTTRSGGFRPLLLVFCLASLLPTHTAGLSLIVFYLLLEVAVETLTIDQATEQDAPLQLGFLAALRTTGLWLGLIVQNSKLALPIKQEHLHPLCLVALLLFWAAVKEKRSDSLCSLSLTQSQKPALTTLQDSFHEVCKKWSIPAVFHLFGMALLAGTVVGGVLPYPLLHPGQAALWFGQVVFTLKVLLLGLIWTYLLEKFEVSRQILVTSAGSLVYLSLEHFGWTEYQFVFLGAFFSSILLSCRAVLRETFRVPASLRSSLLVSLWIVGCLSGELARQQLAPSELRTLQVTLGIGSLLFSLLSYSHYAKVGGIVSAPAKRSERFGDRTLDFEAAPDPSGLKRRSTLLPFLFDQLFVNLPVKIFLSITITSILLFVTHLFSEKQSLQKQLETSVKVFHTKLLLSALDRRLREDMLASQRTPTDWKNFMATNFSSHSGKALGDQDPWGTPLRFESSKELVVITSAGPDLRFETSDDLQQQTTKPTGVK